MRTKKARKRKENSRIYYLVIFTRWTSLSTMGEAPTGSCYCERVKYEYTGNPLKKVSTYLKYIPNCVWLPVVHYLLTPLPRSRQFVTAWHVASWLVPPTRSTYWFPRTNSASHLALLLSNPIPNPMRVGWIWRYSFAETVAPWPIKN
jgi:hypothetical protein